MNDTNAMPLSFESPVVSAQWLIEQIQQTSPDQSHMHNSELKLIDASWHLPAAGRNPRSEYAEAHIPGAVFFDIDEHAAKSHLPHMLPDAESFASAVGAMGIDVNDSIVVYDTHGLFSAARVWWMFRYFGAGRVAVLDGGLPAWIRAGGSCEAQSDNRVFSTTNKSDSWLVARDETVVDNAIQLASPVVNAAGVLQASANTQILIVDARPEARFTAQQPEAREGLASGHIPNSMNLPFTALLDDQGLLKSSTELSALFMSIGLKPDQQVITTCGSGVTAAVLILALNMIGHSAPVALYDGSWAEWGSLPDMPVLTGQ